MIIDFISLKFCVISWVIIGIFNIYYYYYFLFYYLFIMYNNIAYSIALVWQLNFVKYTLHITPLSNFIYKFVCFCNK